MAQQLGAAVSPGYGAGLSVAAADYGAAVRRPLSWDLLLVFWPFAVDDHYVSVFAQQPGDPGSGHGLGPADLGTFGAVALRYDLARGPGVRAPVDLTAEQAWAMVRYLLVLLVAEAGLIVQELLTPAEPGPRGPSWCSGAASGSPPPLIGSVSRAERLGLHKLARVGCGLPSRAAHRPGPPVPLPPPVPLHQSHSTYPHP